MPHPNHSNTQLALQRLEKSTLPQQWVSEHPDGWDNDAFQRFLGELEAKNFWPIDSHQVQALLCAIHERIAPPASRIVRRESPTAADTRRVMRYATADWADPDDFAERHRYQPGDLWLGRDLVSGRSLGFRDERHTMILGSTRGYKGTTCIVPAHLTWPGSLFSLDPKGENATISAARRGNGNDNCIGMGQVVNVVDPFGVADVEDQYRKRFNPLDALDPEDDEFIEKSAAVADAMVVRPPDEREPFWSNKARTLIKGLILHIKTAPYYEGRRNLITLRELAIMGDVGTINLLKDAGYEDETKDENGKPFDPFLYLFKGMQRNNACGNVIAGIGTEFHALLLKGVDRQWSGFHSSLTDQTEFLDSPKLQAAISESDFSTRDIKDHPDGMSLYLCLPTKHMATYHRWLRVMTNLVIYECRRSTSMPANGHRVLMCLDEFRTLEHMPEIERDISNLAGYGVKLMLILQDLGQLKRNYKDGWETIWGSCGLIHAFAINDDFTLKRLSDHIGETDLVLDTLTQTEGLSAQRSQTVSRTQSATQGQSSSRSSSQNTSRSEAIGESTSTAFGRHTSDASGWSTNSSRGTSSNKSNTANQSRSEGWSPPSLFGRNLHGAFPFLRDNETVGTTNGSSDTSGTGNSRGSSRGESSTHTEGQSETDTTGRSATQTQGFTSGTSDTVGRSSSDTHSVGTTHGTSEGHNHSVALGQSHHKRPLIYPHDIKYFFASLKPGEYCYPGLGLVLVPSERPMLVQRVNYFEDDGFDGLWDFNPSYPQTIPRPLVRSWTIGFELEERNHLWRSGTPRIGRWHKKAGDRVKLGEAVCEIIPGPATTGLINTRLNVYAPATGYLETINAPEGSEFVSGMIMGSIKYHIADALRERSAVVPDEIGAYNRGEHPAFREYIRREIDAAGKKIEAERAAAAERERKRLKAEEACRRFEEVKELERQKNVERLAYLDQHNWIHGAAWWVCFILFSFGIFGIAQSTGLMDKSNKNVIGIIIFTIGWIVSNIAKAIANSIRLRYFENKWIEKEKPK